MKKLCLLALLVISGLLTITAQRYEKYTNERYFFSIDYPSDQLQMQPPSHNGDGRIFLSKEGDIELRVWAEYNVMFHSIQQELEWTEKNLKNVQTIYKKAGNSWFVISGTANDKIFYQKTLYHKFKNTDTFFTFTIEYPKNKKKKFDAIVKRIERSFTFDANADV